MDQRESDLRMGCDDGGQCIPVCVATAGRAGLMLRQKEGAFDDDDGVVEELRVQCEDFFRGVPKEYKLWHIMDVIQINAVFFSVRKVWSQDRYIPSSISSLSQRSSSRSRAQGEGTALL